MKKAAIFTLALLALAAADGASAAAPLDSLVKASGTAVYYYAADGKRYVFPDQGTYHSWFTDFSAVALITDAELATMPLGGNVTYRPGIRMIKIVTDPKVYAVGPQNTLHWVVSEQVAEDLYGQYWATAVKDVSDAFFTDYRIGEPVGEEKDFSPLTTARLAETVNAALGIPAGTAPRLADTEPANIVDAWRRSALDHINLLRANNGKPPLVLNPLLNRIATIHSKDMALHDHFAHEGTLGETADDRIRYGKVPDLSTGRFTSVPHPEDIDWTGENLGHATRRNRDTVESTIAKLHELFMDEPPDGPNHRTTMLSTLRPYSEIGIGPYVDAEGDLWLTEDYISR